MVRGFVNVCVASFYVAHVATVHVRRALQVYDEIIYAYAARLH